MHAQEFTQGRASRRLLETVQVQVATKHNFHGQALPYSLTETTYVMANRVEATMEYSVYTYPKKIWPILVAI